MTYIDKLIHEFVEHIPKRLTRGTLYISKKYNTAIHSCCCGCGTETVTPLGPDKWQLKEDNGMISLYPSIGNQNLPCKSHYWITENHVKWA